MQVKGKTGLRLVGKLGVAGALLLASGLTANYAKAVVTGRCDMCHTMHNSQDGTTLVHAGSGSHWDNGGALVGGGTAEQGELLKTDCVGCHSSTSANTIINVDGNNIPIVYNTGGYPAQPLAGGNFAGVATDETKGHNVYGISAVDTKLTNTFGALGAGGAPGHNSGCASSCHSSLAIADSVTSPFTDGNNRNGCRGCHQRVGHHNLSDPSYRFLGGHGAPGVDYVSGGGTPVGGHNPYESADWEQVPSTGNHNFYQSQTDPNDYTGITALCAGCHGRFHAMGSNNLSNVDNGGDPNSDNLTVANSIPSNPWLRHPSSVNIPNDGEYANLFGGTTQYNPSVPVARVIGETSATLVVGDQVFCLSCHRAHGSDQSDALRFPYADMNAHSYGSAGNSTGCFYCHNTKDNS